MPGFEDAFNDIFDSYLSDNPTHALEDSSEAGSSYGTRPSNQGDFASGLSRVIRNGATDSEGNYDPLGKYLDAFKEKGFIPAGNRVQIAGMPGNSVEGQSLTPQGVFERGAGKPGHFVSGQQFFGDNDVNWFASDDGSSLNDTTGRNIPWTSTDSYGNGLDAFAKTAYGFYNSPGVQLAKAGMGLSSGVESGLNFFGGGDFSGGGGADWLTGGEDDLTNLVGGRPTGLAASPDQVIDPGPGGWVNPETGGPGPGVLGGGNYPPYADPGPGGWVNPATGRPGPGLPGGQPYSATTPQQQGGAPTSAIGGQFVDPTTLQMSGGAPMSMSADFSAPSFDGGGGDFAFGEGGMPLGSDSSLVDPDDPDKLLRQQQQVAPVTTPAGAAPAAGKGAAAGAGGADKSFIQKAIDSVTKNPMQAASLGANIYAQSQASKNGKSAQDQLTKLSEPARNASTSLIAQGMSGNVPAPIMQQFQTTLQNTISAINSRYVNMGRDPNNDSSAQAEIKQAKDQMDAQVANYASTLLQQGLSAAGVANGPATAAINAGVAQDKELSNAMAQSLQQMAMLQAMQKGKEA